MASGHLQLKFSNAGETSAECSVEGYQEILETVLVEKVTLSPSNDELKQRD